MTQWEKLFGTPERSARTIAAIGDMGCTMAIEASQSGLINGCYGCPLEGCPNCPIFEEGEGERPFTEWLESEVRDA